MTTPATKENVLAFVKANPRCTIMDICRAFRKDQPARSSPAVNITLKRLERMGKVKSVGRWPDNEEGVPPRFFAP